MDIQNINKTIIQKDVEDELIWMTASKYALFMSYGKIGIDAKALYEHYQFTCIMQKTNNVWAADKYCRQGLDWGRDRFEKAKKLLLDLGLIEINQQREESGKWGKIYIKVKMRKVELELADLDRMPEKPQAGKTASGKTATNALTKKGNALTKKGNALTPPNYEEIKSYFEEKKFSICPLYFYEYFKESNWYDSKGNKVINWKQKAITWNKFDTNYKTDNKTKANTQNKPQQTEWPEL